MIQILKYHLDEDELFDLGCQVRTEVFIVEQEVDRAIEFEFEEESTHYLLLEDSVPVTTGRWRHTPLGIKLERFAVLEDERGKGFGMAILKRILDDVLGLEMPIYLHAQESAVGFYENAGFVKIGDPFMEADIVHYKMRFGG